MNNQTHETVRDAQIFNVWTDLERRVRWARHKRSPAYWVRVIRKIPTSNDLKLALANQLKMLMSRWCREMPSIDQFISRLQIQRVLLDAATQTDPIVVYEAPPQFNLTDDLLAMLEWDLAPVNPEATRQANVPDHNAMDVSHDQANTATYNASQVEVAVYAETEDLN